MSPSQASETCASASSATSAWEFTIRTTVRECQTRAGWYAHLWACFSRTSWLAKSTPEACVPIGIATFDHISFHMSDGDDANNHSCYNVDIPRLNRASRKYHPAKSRWRVWVHVHQCDHRVRHDSLQTCRISSSDFASGYHGSHDQRRHQILFLFRFLGHALVQTPSLK